MTGESSQEVQDDFTKNVLKGLLGKARQHLVKGGKKLEEGAIDQVGAHFQDASKIIGQVAQSPDLWVRLTPGERSQYKILQRRIERGEMSDNDWLTYKNLGNKATGGE